MCLKTRVESSAVEKTKRCIANNYAINRGTRRETRMITQITGTETRECEIRGQGKRK